MKVIDVIRWYWKQTKWNKCSDMK